MKLVTGEKVRIVGGEVDFHGFEDETIVEFVREHNEPVHGYMVRGIQDGTETTVKVLHEHIEKM